MSDVLVHEYFGVRLDSVWSTIENRLPELKRRVDAMLADEAE